jgi:benzoyl-CoA reductase/2-hydroxyglutaryl-CoA dehydratase subunit BcrC/BadD/HgdB
VIERADALAPSFTCPFMRLSLERMLAGRYDFLTGVVQAYTCDAACGMLEIWKEHAKGSLFASLPLPYNDNPAICARPSPSLAKDS